MKAFAACVGAAVGILSACSDDGGGAASGGTAGASVSSVGGAAGNGAAGGPSSGGRGGQGTGGASTGGSGAGGSSAGGSSAGGGGAGAGGGGDAGDAGLSDARVTSDADAAVGLTMPIVRGDLDVLEFGPMSFAVNPGKGARITSFKLDGDEMLADATAHPQYWGSTLWTSPASDWVVPGTFVPPAVVDSDPYMTTVSADGVITATSAPSTANGKRFVVAKVFHADLAKRTIVIDYKITNMGTATFKLSHWEVTRVLPGGLLFYPTGTTQKLDFLKQVVQVKQAQGYTWYDNTSHVNGMGESKAGADSPGGFVAEVAPHANGDLLFVKAFKSVPLAAAPPGHYPVEFYCNDPHTYVEIEDHSAYADIAPGATYTQTVTWYLRRLPAGTDRSVGSSALIAAVMTALNGN
jgi:Domain of unknown function (DUF4380)